MGRFQIVSFLYVVYSREFVNFSHAEIACIMNTNQELEEILEVSNAVYINMYLANVYYLVNILEVDFLLSFFTLSFQFGLALTLPDEISSWRHIKKY